MQNKYPLFFTLLRAGLWERKIELSSFDKKEFDELLRLASEQSVVGLIAAGIEHVRNVCVPKDVILELAGNALQIEQRNKAMNDYVAKLTDELRKEDIYAILVKGQGIAQCYERPMWRSCGDIDLLLSDDNYQKARNYLIPQAIKINDENYYKKHLGMTIGLWDVELHGSLRGCLWKSIDSVINDAQRSVFFEGHVRSWDNNGNLIFLPRADEDVIFVFTHILQHFFVEGIGLRQICDWCRLLWKYHPIIDFSLLEKRLRKAGVMTEWKVFASLAVVYLGMPKDAMPFYSENQQWERKAERLMNRIIATGNFGHNIDKSFRKTNPFVVRKIKAVWGYLSDTITHSFIFPVDSFKVLCSSLAIGIRSTLGMKL